MFKVENIKYSLRAYIIGLVLLSFNPQFWIKGKMQILTRNLEVGNLSYPIIVFPLFNILSFFWIPSYIWCFSCCNMHVLPLIIPLICFIILVYRRILKKEVSFDTRTLLWLSSSLITLSILPKHFTYYNIILIPPLALFTSEIAFNDKVAKISVWKKIIFIPASFMIALSPLQLIISLAFPTGWWFLWDIIRNPQVMGFYSLVAFIISFIAFVWGILFAFIFL